MPETCKICEKQYHTVFGQKPPIECAVCRQGIHEVCFNKIMENYTEIPKIPGLKWVCIYCEPRLTLSSAYTAKTPVKRQSKCGISASTPSIATDAQISQTTIAKTTSLTADATVVIQRQTASDINLGDVINTLSQTISQTDVDHPEVVKREETKAELETKVKNKPICIHYRRGNCKHGQAGKECAFQHPPKCRRYMAFGDADKRRGCTRGSTCKFYHPKLCKNSVEHKECLTAECRFVHLKGTKRTRKEEITDIAKSTQATEIQKINDTTRTMTYLEAAKVNIPGPQGEIAATIPRQNIQIQQQQHQMSELLQNIQEKLLNMEKQQNGQMEVINGILMQQQQLQNQQVYYTAGLNQPQLQQQQQQQQVHFPGQQIQQVHYPTGQPNNHQPVQVQQQQPHPVQGQTFATR